MGGGRGRGMQQVQNILYIVYIYMQTNEKGGMDRQKKQRVACTDPLERRPIPA